MKSTPGSLNQEVLAGLVERVTFHNAENGFCVLRAKARGHRDLVTVVGHAAIISAGEWITASGEWINDRAHGQQFKARCDFEQQCYHGDLAHPDRVTPPPAPQYHAAPRLAPLAGLSSGDNTRSPDGARPHR
jgi:hypothetical protein